MAANRGGFLPFISPFGLTITPALSVEGKPWCQGSDTWKFDILQETKHAIYRIHLVQGKAINDNFTEQNRFQN